MKQLEYKSNYEPRYEANLEELFLDIKFIPFQGNKVTEQPPGWLFLSTLFPQRPLMGWVYAEASDALIEAINGHSIYGAERRTIANQHTLNLVWRSDQRIFLYQKFQQIIGSHNLCEVAEDELKVWLRRAVKGQELPQHTWLEE